MYDKGRFYGLTEGIYAIAVTLLVLDIKLPGEEPIRLSADLAAKLWEMRSIFAHWIISFSMCLYFWTLSIGLTEKLKSYEIKDILYCYFELYFVCMIPFSTSLISTHGSELAFIIFNLNLWLIHFIKYLKWRRINKTNSPHHLISIQTSFTILSLFTVLSTFLAFSLPSVSMYLWLFFPFAVQLQRLYNAPSTTIS